MNPSEPNSSVPPAAVPKGDSAVQRVGRRKTRLLLPLAAILLATAGGTWLWANGLAQKRPQPAFGTLTVAPPNFVFNAPTAVTFTISIPAPTLNPTTVELQRVDANGVFQFAVAPMRDDGIGADTRAGDRVFTARIQVNEPTVGKIYFQAAAAFQGISRNSSSAVTAVDVDPFPLPPDPGEAGQQTLEGIDFDNDGVRDDVQRWIALNYLGQPSAVNTLRAYAASHQSLITTSSDFERNAAHKRRTRAIGCWQHLFAEDDFKGLDAADGVILNTAERFAGLRVAEGHFAGRIWTTESDEFGQAACVGLE